MTQDIYDDPHFFTGYATLDRSVNGLDGAPEWPALQKMLPPLRGKIVVDLGCGYGGFSRWTRGKGAAKVTGLDVSQKMLAKARSMTEDPDIDYQRCDLETLHLTAQSIDLAYRSLALHYLNDINAPV